MKKLILLFCCSAFLLYGQTPQENLKKYWNYRDRQKKYFIRYGTGPGESIPVSARCSQNTPPGFGLNCVCGGVDNDVAHVFWGDGTIWMGYHLAVLATEYELLQQYGQDTKHTLDEIYFVLS